MVLPKYRTSIFVNGCFWHMHEGCPKATRVPKSNVEFWTAKLLRNRERDMRQHAELEVDGWNVIVVWECELGKKTRDERLERLYHEIVDERNVRRDGIHAGISQIETDSNRLVSDGGRVTRNVVETEAWETLKTARGRRCRIARRLPIRSAPWCSEPWPMR